MKVKISSKTTNLYFGIKKIKDGKDIDIHNQTKVKKNGNTRGKV